MSEEKIIAKKAGRPKKVKKAEDTALNETGQERLDMDKRQQTESQEDYVSIEEVTKAWNTTLKKIGTMYDYSSTTTSMQKWNNLNPFLQNQRIKDIYTRAKRYSKGSISEFLASPGNYEKELRSLAWANSSSQQIYYNILRRSCDVPLYKYFFTPDVESDFSSDKFDNDERFLQHWTELLNIADTFKTIAMEVKREGKSSYLLRNKFEGEGKSKEPTFVTLQKLPTDWIKITSKGQLGYVVSFNLMYFMNIANSPSRFGDFIEEAWNNLVDNEIVEKMKDKEGNFYKYEFHPEKAYGHTFSYANEEYSTILEKARGKDNYMFWIKMPWDICYTFGSDNSHPWATPDTMGLMLKLQELTDYGQLAGLIASTPLTAVLTGEIETVPQPRAGKNESVFNPEVIEGYMTQFNQATSTNIEAWMWPAKNIKLQQLSSDVNSSDIISTATENFIESAGEGGLTIVDTKPNVAMVKTAQLLSEAQQEYVTIQFNKVLNFIIQHKLGLTYHWKITLWGGIFTFDSEKKHLKEIVANGNIALLPKLMSAEGISMRDTKAITDYIKSKNFYKDFKTYTQDAQAAQKEKQTSQTGAGRPALDDGDIENDATAASRDRGDNTSDNRI